jgi:TIR domain
MFVFLSYAREDREMAERIRGTLAAAGFDCFLDTRSLPPGQEYNARIGQAVARADLFIFLLSPSALEPGSYALTELAFAEKKWRNPAGYVLPVASAKFDFGALPAYLRPINALQPRGSTDAEVLAWGQERAEQGGGGGEECCLGSSADRRRDPNSQR